MMRRMFFMTSDKRARANEAAYEDGHLFSLELDVVHPLAGG